MKIGDEVYVRGYIDEIRKDTVIIRNDGGYFGTVQEEISVKQEPCEDAISRQAALEQTYLWSKDEFLRVTNPFGYLRKRINSLPPVKPQEPKTGHWIANAPQYDMLNPQYICSECGNAHTRITPYCEMCGTKMVEPQESEVVNEDNNRYTKRI